MKKILMGVVLAVTMLMGVDLVSTNVALAAGNVCEDKTIDKDLRELAGCFEGDDKEKTVMGTVEGLVKVAMSVVGIVAVAVIVYGGFMYVTSTGDTAKTTRAKNIIIYGVVGMIVAILAWAIVSFISASIS